MINRANIIKFAYPTSPRWHKWNMTHINTWSIYGGWIKESQAGHGEVTGRSQALHHLRYSDPDVV